MGGSASGQSSMKELGGATFGNAWLAKTGTAWVHTTLLFRNVVVS